jgi:hypothetical protein
MSLPIGELLLKLGYINKTQLKKALAKQSEEKIIYNRSIQLGKVLIDMEIVSVDDIAEALTEQSKKSIKKEEEKEMPTEIGESSKFTFDLKFLITMGAVIVSGCGIYFTMNSAIDELKSSNSPSRLEHDMIANEISNIKNAGNLDIITYKLEEYDKAFEEIKELVNDLKPLKSDLEYIKKEIENLKNIDPVKIPEVDLSGIESSIDNLSLKIEGMESKINEYEDRLKNVEESGGGRF